MNLWELRIFMPWSLLSLGYPPSGNLIVMTLAWSVSTTSFLRPWWVPTRNQPHTTAINQIHKSPIARPWAVVSSTGQIRYMVLCLLGLWKLPATLQSSIKQSQEQVVRTPMLPFFVDAQRTRFQASSTSLDSPSTPTCMPLDLHPQYPMGTSVNCLEPAKYVSTFSWRPRLCSVLVSHCI